MNNAKRPDAVAALPAQRYVTVIAQDPSVRQNGPKSPILMARIAVPAEDLIPGPIGYRLNARLPRRALAFTLIAIATAGGVKLLLG